MNDNFFVKIFGATGIVLSLIVFAYTFFVLGNSTVKASSIPERKGISYVVNCNITNPWNSVTVNSGNKSVSDLFGEVVKFFSFVTSDTESIAKKKTKEKQESFTRDDFSDHVYELAFWFLLGLLLDGRNLFSNCKITSLSGAIFCWKLVKYHSVFRINYLMSLSKILYFKN